MMKSTAKNLCGGQGEHESYETKLFLPAEGDFVYCRVLIIVV